MPRTTPSSVFLRDKAQSVHSVPLHVTVGILVSGFVGGLVLVIAVILVCKYCIKKGKNYSPDHPFERYSVKGKGKRPTLLQRYETINSELFSENSTGSMDVLSISPFRYLESRELTPEGNNEVNELTTLTAEFERDRNTCETTSFKTPTTVIRQHSDESNGGERRVSFQLQRKNQENPYIQQARRYTEGDFHHLKKSRIEKRVARQYSLRHQIPHNRGDLELERSVLCFNDEGETTAFSKSGSLNSTLEVVPVGDSPTSEQRPTFHQTEVSVQVHYCANNNAREEVNFKHFSDRLQTGEEINLKRFSDRLQTKHDRKNRWRSSSQSFPDQRVGVFKDNRKVKSYDNIQDDPNGDPGGDPQDKLLLPTHVDLELDSPVKSKVRYNDTGSIEMLNEEKLDQMDMNNPFEIDNMGLDDAFVEEVITDSQKYREIWNLRTTLEEEEECSDTLRMEDMTSAEESPDMEVPIYDNHSYESILGYVRYAYYRQSSAGRRPLFGVYQPMAPLPGGQLQLHQGSDDQPVTLSGGSMLAKSHDVRFSEVEKGTEKDQDMMESGHVNKMAELSTEKRDSNNDSQNKLIQMKSDSGYKSLEAQIPYVKRHHSTGEIEEVLDEEMLDEEEQMKISRPYVHSNSLPDDSGEPGRSSKYFARRKEKTASKKRREFSRERQIVRVCESINEPEVEPGCSSNQSSVDVPEKASTRFSLFTRFFKSHGEHPFRDRADNRDYSIDEATNNVFQEFVRYDPNMDPKRKLSYHHHHHHHRMQRKHSSLDEKRKKRMTSGSASSSVSGEFRDRTSGQTMLHDSFEEETENIDECDDDGDALEGKKSISGEEKTPASTSGQELPVIQFPEEELCTEV